MLKHLFSKTKKCTHSNKTRIKYGIFASLYGIFSNLLISISMFIIGFLGNSVALISQSLNSLSDGISSGVSLFGFKIANKPADKKHPFGYARFEYISALIIAFIICIIGGMLFKSSIDKIISPTEIIVSTLMIIVLSCSVAIKLSQYLLYRKIGILIDSKSIEANKVDARNDTIVSLLTLIAMIVMKIASINIDAYIGLAVSLFIIISGFKVLLDSIKPLIGEKPDKELVKKIKRKLDSFDGVLSYHELIVHSYGNNINFVSVHIEVSADVNPLITHELIDQIEESFLKDLKIHLVVHSDPVQINNNLVNELKSKTQKILSKLDRNLIVNDFRVSEKSKYTLIMFDCTVPYGIGISKTKICNLLKEKLLYGDRKFKFQIDIDRDYI